MAMFNWIDYEILISGRYVSNDSESFIETHLMLHDIFC